MGTAGIDGGTSQDWLGIWQTVAERRGRAWAGGFGAAGKGRLRQQLRQRPGFGLGREQRKAAAGRWSCLTKRQEPRLQHSTACISRIRNHSGSTVWRDCPAVTPRDALWHCRSRLCLLEPHRNMALCDDPGLGDRPVSLSMHLSNSCCSRAAVHPELHKHAAAPANQVVRLSAEFSQSEGTVTEVLKWQ